MAKDVILDENWEMEGDTKLRIFSVLLVYVYLFMIVGIVNTHIFCCIILYAYIYTLNKRKLFSYVKQSSTGSKDG